MKNRIIVIDGYNVINNWADLRETAELDMAVAREALIERMVNYAGLAELQIKIVFDAHLVKNGSGSREVRHDVEIIYTRQGVTADEYIEKVTAEAGEEIIVVTADGAEQGMIFGHGALRMTPMELWEAVKRAREAVEQFNKKPTLLERSLVSRLDGETREILEGWRRQK